MALDQEVIDSTFAYWSGLVGSHQMVDGRYTYIALVRNYTKALEISGHAAVVVYCRRNLAVRAYDMHYPLYTLSPNSRVPSSTVERIPHLISQEPDYGLPSLEELIASSLKATADINSILALCQSYIGYPTNMGGREGVITRFEYRDISASTLGIMVELMVPAENDAYQMRYLFRLGNVPAAANVRQFRPQWFQVSYGRP